MVTGLLELEVTGVMMSGRRLVGLGRPGTWVSRMPVLLRLSVKGIGFLSHTAPTPVCSRSVGGPAGAEL